MFIEAVNQTAEWLALAQLRDADAAVKAFSIYSHIPLLLTVVVALYFRYIQVAVLQMLTFCVSVAYHACQAYDACLGYDLPLMQRFDHVTATLSVLTAAAVLTSARDERLVNVPFGADEAVINEDLSAAADKPNEDTYDTDFNDEPLKVNMARRTTNVPAYYHLHFARFALPLQLIVVFMATVDHPYDIYPVFAALAVSLVTILVYNALFRVERRTQLTDGRLVVWTVSLNPVFTLLALALGGLGLWCFLGNPYNPVQHSFWHIFAGLAIAALIFAVELPFKDSPFTLLDVWRSHEREDRESGLPSHPAFFRTTTQ